MSDGYTPIESMCEPAFGDSPGERAAERVLATLRANLDQVDASTHRALRNLMLSIVAFEFLVLAAVGEVVIAGLRLADLSVVQKFLPFLTAFLFYQMMTALAARRVLIDAHDDAMSRLSPSISLIHLKSFLRPPTILGAETLLSSLATGKVNIIWKVPVSRRHSRSCWVPLQL